MSIVYRMNGPLVVVTPYGSNTLENVCGLFKDILGDPAFKPPAKILFDARHTDYGPPGEELEALSEFLSEIEAFRGSRWAIVAHSGTLVYGLTRMFCCLAESHGIYAEPFSEYTEAHQWLLNSNWGYQNRKCPLNEAFGPVRLYF